MKIWILPITAVLLTACASSDKKAAEIKTRELQKAAKSVPICARTQANLTMRFEERIAKREYHCISKNYAPSFARNLQYANLAPLPAAKPAALPENDSHDIGRVETLPPLTISHTQIKAAPAAVNPVMIPFAAHSDLLGAAGKKAVADFAKRYQKSPLDVIYLQAIVSTQSRLNKDQGALGRALSVRKSLKKHGIGTKMRILNRNSTRYHPLKTDGNYVEVTVDAS